MKRCAIGDLKPGMVLGDPIFHDNGDIMLQQGTRLTESLVKNLQSRDDITFFLKRMPETGLPAIEIMEDEDLKPTATEPSAKTPKEAEQAAASPTEPAPPAEIPASICSDPKREKLLDLNYVETYKDVMEDLRVLFSRQGSMVLNLTALKELIDSSRMKQLCDSSRAVTQIHNIPREERNYLLHHSLHVAILAGLMGKWLGWPKVRQHCLMFAGLLLDVGKLKIAQALLNKPGVLSNSERTILHKHSAMGCELLKESGLDENDEAMIGIMQHHERCDGSGYPLQLKKNQITPFGHILGILDSYDAMASSRNYSQRKSPFDIFEIFRQETVGGKFNPEYSVLFTNRVSQSLTGSWVRLTDGRKAKIIYLDQSRTGAMPIVELEDGTFLNTGTQSVKVKELLTYVEAIS